MDKLFHWYIIYFSHIRLLSLGQFWNSPSLTNFPEKDQPHVCTSDDDCQNIDGNSFCSTMDYFSSKCQCANKFKYLYDRCKPECDLSDCSSYDLSKECNMQGTCHCKYKHIKKRGKCTKVPKSLGDYCSASEDCRKIAPYSYCMVNNDLGSCRCLSGYEQFNSDKCLKATRLGQYCSTDLECIISDGNSRCHSYCQCNEGFIQLGQICVLGWQNLGDVCTSSYECQNFIPNSICIQNRPSEEFTCQCAFNYEPYGKDKCIKDFNKNYNKPTDTVSLTAIIGTVICVAVIIISLFLCGYRHLCKNRGQICQRQETVTPEEPVLSRGSSIRRSIRSFLARLPYSDPPPPYEVAVAQKYQDLPPSYIELQRTSQEHTNQAFVPDSEPSGHI